MWGEEGIGKRTGGSRRRDKLTPRPLGTAALRRGRWGGRGTAALTGARFARAQANKSGARIEGRVCLGPGYAGAVTGADAERWLAALLPEAAVPHAVHARPPEPLRSKGRMRAQGRLFRHACLLTDAADGRLAAGG